MLLIDVIHCERTCCDIDMLIGKLLKKLETLGALNDTIIAISADHGLQMGS